MGSRAGGGESMATRSNPATRIFTPLSALAIAAIVALSASLASAQSAAELREERRQVQAEAAEIAVEVDALTAEVDDLSAALEAAQANVDAQTAALEAANRTLADAEATQQEALAAVAELEAEQTATRVELQAAIVDNYVNHQGFDELEALTDDPWAASRAETIASFGSATGLEGLDDLRRIGAELQLQQDLADEAAAQAEATRNNMENLLEELEEARALEEQLLEDAVIRQELRLSEAAALAELEADLSAQIQAEEARLAREIANRLPSGGGGVTVPPGGDFELTTVNGITINTEIADNLAGFMAAMADRGFILGGGGYRSSDSQVALRRSNCGTSDYAIWQMPASQCSPPTARPGLSQHEVGLAIDFTYNGRIITSRSTAVFQAMAAIAADFGFYNLPSEPWHWSTTGN